MEKIKVFKGSPAFGKFYIIAGCLFALLGLIVTVKNLTDGFDPQFRTGDWSFILFTFQGILFLIMGWSFVNSRKYFIQWDENELNYLLPDTKKIRTIRLNDIQSVNIKLFEIVVDLKEGRETISLENLEFEDIKKIKEKFSGWKV